MSRHQYGSGDLHRRVFPVDAPVFRQHALSMQTLPEEETLAQVRRLRKRTQGEVAIKLSTRQSEISRFERRRDAHVSSLAAYVAAIGGTLDLVARFPGQSIRIRLGHP
jgi:hypothetical protein